MAKENEETIELGEKEKLTEILSECYEVAELESKKDDIQKKDIQHLNAICRIQMGNGYIKQFVENLMYGPMKKSGVL